MKGKRTKKITLSISALAVVTAIITVVALLVNTQNQKAKLLADPEIQKSMEYEQVQEGDEKVPNTDYVQFDAFFLRDLDGDGYAEQVRGMCRDINKTDTLYMNLNVLTNGKLVDGKITIKTSNMNLSTAIVEDNVIKQNYISNNTTEIALKDINNGTQKLIYGTVNASNFGNDTNKYSQVNSVVLTGKHIADDGTETQISKKVDFNVDWYGSVTASISNYTGTQNIEEITDENKENITLNFSVTTRETTDDLILKKAVLEGTIPTVNGYKPTSVELTSSDVNFEYDEETGNFTITREASINEAGIVTKTVSDYNTFNFKVTYPYELYESLTGDTLSLIVPVKAYYEASGKRYSGKYKTGDVIKAAPAVQKVTSVKSEKSGIRIRWKPQKKCDGYYIYRKKKGGSYQLIKKISNGNSSSYLDKKAQKGVSYYYAVKAYVKEPYGNTYSKYKSSSAVKRK